MLDAKEGQTYICTKSERPWWTEGKEYTIVLDCYGKAVMKDNDGDNWSSLDLETFNNEFKLKETNKMSKLDFKEGQTYICKRDDLQWWTLDKEYKIVFDKNHELVIVDDDESKWYVTNNLMNNVFKLKEQTFDLNTLTIEQLKEYVGLLEDKEKAENLINDFIERMTK